MRKLINQFTWSVSRASLFNTCRRAYYYNYYGSWGGWEKDASERVRKLYVLKNIATMEMWCGSIVHQVVAEALNRYARREHQIRAGELQARAREMLRQGWKEAVGRHWMTSPKKTNLMGLYYGNGKTLPRERTDQIKEKTYRCLAAFAESDVLKEITAAPYMSWKPVDKLDAFTVDGLKVWCAVDFAYVDPEGKLHIIDWKTGSEKRDSLRVQLACYAYYAEQKWFSDSSNLRLRGVFLSENARESVYPLSQDDLLEAKDFILTSAADMRALLRDVEGNVAEEEDFDFCGSERVCQYCNFGEVCPRVQRPSAFAG